MKTTAACEINLDHHRFVDEYLSQLTLPEIPLTVPTLGETILINSPSIDDKRAVVMEIERPGKAFHLRRVDDTPLQVMQADNRRENYAMELFGEPVDNLTYIRINARLWRVDVDPGRVNDNDMLREFTAILSSFALSKQLRIRAAASEASTG